MIRICASLRDLVSSSNISVFQSLICLIFTDICKQAVFYYLSFWPCLVVLVWMSLQNAKATIKQHSRKRSANFDLAVDFENKKSEDCTVGLQLGSTDGRDSNPKARAVLQTNHLVWQVFLASFPRELSYSRFQNEQRSRFSFFLESRTCSFHALPADPSTVQISA